MNSTCLFPVVLVSVKAFTHLRSNVIWSSTEGPCGRAFKYVFFAHPKIGQLTVTVFVQKNIVQF